MTVLHSPPSTKPSVLIVSAFEPEQDQFLEWQGQYLNLGGHSCRVDLRCAGVGNLNAAVFLSEYLSSPGGADCTEILFIGSCGAYAPQDIAIPGPGLVLARHFGLVELSVLRGEAHQPDLMETRLESPGGPLAAHLESLGPHPARLNCPGALSLIAVAAGPWTHENLECGGLAVVARRHGKPFSALLAVTNVVGPEGSAQWRANYRKQSLSLQALVKKCLNPCLVPW